jgi:hypothetical protein
MTQEVHTASAESVKILQTAELIVKIKLKVKWKNKIETKSYNY